MTFKNKPLDVLEETDLFGVQDPDCGELLFISVMSTGLAISRGVEGLYGWREFCDALQKHPQNEALGKVPHDDDPVIVFRAVSQLPLSFEQKVFSKNTITKY